MTISKIALPLFAGLRTELSNSYNSVKKYAAQFQRMVRSALDIDSEVNKAILRGEYTISPGTLNLCKEVSVKSDSLIARKYILKVSDNKMLTRSFPQYVVDQSVRAVAKFSGRAEQSRAGQGRGIALRVRW